MGEIDLSDQLSTSLSTLGMGNLRGQTCITCSDEGRLLQIVSLSADGLTAVGRCEDGEETVDVSLVGTTQLGDMILVHAGVAITKVETKYE